MRRLSIFGGLSLSCAAIAIACSSSSGGSGFGGTGGDGGSSQGSSSGSTSSSSSGSGAVGDGGGQTIGLGANDDGGGNQQQGIDGGEIVTTTIYAHTDSELYSMDPDTKVVTDIGPFSGVRDAAADYEDQAVTDLAVDAEGDIYVITEAFLYKATLPASGKGPVVVNEVAQLQGGGTGSTATKYVALAFAPAGLLGSGESLVAGDENGEVWSVDPTSGATKDLGNFGSDPNVSGNFFALSGDIVFYTNSSNAPTGIATIRSCYKTTSGSSTYTTCTKNNDYLAGIDITALTGAYTSGTPAASLNGGIYGGAATDSGVGTTGPGVVGYGEIFGLGAWGGNVYGFTNYQSGKDGGAPTEPSFITIDTTTGAGTLVANNFGFTNGWAGAGVTTKVTVTILPPPPPPTPQ